MSRISANSFLVDAEQRIQMSLSNISPDISGLTVAQSNADLLKCDANAQQGNADVSTSNPLFVQFNTGGEEVDIVKVNNTSISLAQKAMALSFPVVIANDQSSIPVAPSEGDVDLVKVGGTAIAIGQAAMGACLPVVIASNQSSIPVSQSVTGSQGNLSNAQSVVASDVSTAVDVSSGSSYTIFGSSSDTSNNVDIEVSIDNSNWYPSGMGLYPDGSGNLFTALQNTPIKYLRLKYNGTATVTAQVSFA
tara:strand:- start:486 stop:1232 length:747 start_codon:yes stop_codon:yes gene_type:complete